MFFVLQVSRGGSWTSRERARATSCAVPVAPFAGRERERGSSRPSQPRPLLISA